MSRLIPARHALAALLPVLLPACKDGAGPEAFDPVALAQQADVVVSTVERNEAVATFEILGEAFTFSGAPAVPLAGVLAPSVPAAILPAGSTGKTFIYSTQTGRYTPSDLPGAPGDAADFLLYRVDSVLRQVVFPLDTIGVLRLTDRSSAASNTLGVTALMNGVPVLEYDASGSLSTTLTFTAEGFVTGGGSRLDFEVIQTASLSTGIRLDYSITTPSLFIRLVGSAATGNTVNDVTLTLTAGENEAQISASGTDQSVTGTVKFNGRTLATISGTGDDPAFVSQNGHVLSDADLAALVSLFEFAGLVFEAFHELLGPAYFVFGLS